MINLLRCLKINTFFVIPASAFFSVEYTFLLVGWLLPIFQRAIFQLKITLYIEMREGWVNRVNDYWFPLENYGEWRTDENVDFCCGYNVPIFSKSTNEVSNVYGALPSPNTLPTMVHGQDFCNIAWQPPSGGLHLSTAWESADQWEIHQYLAFSFWPLSLFPMCKYAAPMFVKCQYPEISLKQLICHGN